MPPLFVCGWCVVGRSVPQCHCPRRQSEAARRTLTLTWAPVTSVSPCCKLQRAARGQQLALAVHGGRAARPARRLSALAERRDQLTEQACATTRQRRGLSSPACSATATAAAAAHATTRGSGGGRHPPLGRTAHTRWRRRRLDDVPAHRSRRPASRPSRGRCETEVDEDCPAGRGGPGTHWLGLGFGLGLGLGLETEVHEDSPAGRGGPGTHSP